MRRSTLFRGLSFSFLLVLVLMQTACVSMANPLVDPEKAAVDQRLFGHWKAADPAKKDDMAHVFIGRPAAAVTKNCPDGLILIHAVGFNDKQELHPAPDLYVFAAKAGNDDYLHVIGWRDAPKGALAEWDRKNVASYMLLKYAVDQERLTLWSMQYDAVKKAVQDGKLKGMIGKGGILETVTVTDAPEALAKYLSQGGDTSLFSDKSKIVLDRVKW